jgi:hypothetical protein
MQRGSKSNRRLPKLSKVFDNNVIAQITKRQVPSLISARQSHEDLNDRDNEISPGPGQYIDMFDNSTFKRVEDPYQQGNLQRKQEFGSMQQRF